MADKCKTFLVTTAEDAPRAMALGAPGAFLYYRIGPGGALMRTLATPTGVRGSIMGIFDDGATDYEAIDSQRLLRDICNECMRQGYGGILLDLPSNALALSLVGALSPELSKRRMQHFVPLDLSGEAAGDAMVIVPSAISGGSFEQMLQGFSNRFGARRLCLEVVRSCNDFSMPSYDADGTPLTAAEFRAITDRLNPSYYFSRDLCAKYFTYQDEIGGIHFLMFDDPATAVQKIQVAGQCGYAAAFLLYRDWGAAARDIILEV